MKKILISLLLSVFIILNLSQTTMAQGGLSNVGSGAENLSTWYSTPFNDWFAKVYNQNTSPPSEIFGERYTAAQVQWIFYSLISLPLTIDPDIAEFAGCVFEATNGVSIVDSGLLDACYEPVRKIMESAFQTISPISQNTTDKNLAQMIFDPTDRPISAIKYASNFIDNANFVEPVYAQGFGYNRLEPIQAFWTGARNIAYALIVLVIIIFSFMIMFRVKITPQLVISVQTALPKVAIALILATFSYAIAGFAIDLMYLFGGMIALLVKSSGLFFLGDVGYIYSNYIFPNNDRGLFFLLAMINYTIVFAITAIVNLILGLGTLDIIEFATANQPGIFFIVMILLTIWLFLLSFWYTFKANWMLIKTIMSVYVSIITAPIQFVLGAIVPSFGFGTWFKKLMADLLVFPLVGVFFMFAFHLLLTSMYFSFTAVFSEGLIAEVEKFISSYIPGYTPPNWTQSLWMPEIVGFGAAVSGFMLQLMSFAIIIAIPKIPDIVKMVLLGEKFAFGSAIGEAMTPVNWAYDRSGAKNLVNMLSEYGSARTNYDLLNNPIIRRLLGSMLSGRGDELSNQPNVDTFLNKQRDKSITNIGGSTGS